MTQSAENDVPGIQGLDLFEVYEDNGALLFVTSTLYGHDLEPTDRVYRRPWATSAEPVRLPGGVNPPEVTR